MKKWILSAALLLAFSGYATAQKSPVKAASKTEQKKPVKKGTEAKTGNVNNPTEKKETEALVKLQLPPMVPDTLAVPPKGKNDQ